MDQSFSPRRVGFLRFVFKKKTELWVTSHPHQCHHSLIQTPAVITHQLILWHDVLTSVSKNVCLCVKEWVCVHVIVLQDWMHIQWWQQRHKHIKNLFFFGVVLCVTHLHIHISHPFLNLSLFFTPTCTDEVIVNVMCPVTTCHRDRIRSLPLPRSDVA